MRKMKMTQSLRMPNRRWSNNLNRRKYKNRTNRVKVTTNQLLTKKSRSKINTISTNTDPLPTTIQPDPPPLPPPHPPPNTSSPQNNAAISKRVNLSPQPPNPIPLPTLTTWHPQSILSPYRNRNHNPRFVGKGARSRN